MEQNNDLYSMKEFFGSVDATTEKEVLFPVTLVGRYIRIYPLEYENGPTMRLELLGCPLEGKMQEN